MISINSNKFQSTTVNFIIKTSFFFIISYLFFQSHEDGEHGLIFKFPDKLFLLVGIFGLAFTVIKFSKKLNFFDISTLTLSFYSFLVTLINIPLVNYDSDLFLKYQPVIHMSYHAIAILMLGVTTCYLNKNKFAGINPLSSLNNLFALISLTFLISYLLFFLGIDIDWGLDHSYGFPRIQGFMIEPSYSGYVFFMLACLAGSRYAKLIYLTCAVTSFSLSFYIGLLVYLLIIHPKKIIIALVIGMLLVSQINFGENFFISKFLDVLDFLKYGEINSGNATRMVTAFEALKLNYSWFGHGLGSTLYVVGSDSTIIPNLLLLAYEIGFIGLLCFLFFMAMLFRYQSTDNLALLLCSFTYWFINGGSIHLFWVALLLITANVINAKEIASHQAKRTNLFSIKNT